MTLIASTTSGFLDVATHCTTWEGFLFVHAIFWTPRGWSDDVPPEPLEHYSTAYLPMGILPDGNNELEYRNALWVRARIPVALGFAPPTCRRAMRYRFIDFTMLAVCFMVSEMPTLMPFICTEVDLHAELQFGRRSTKEQCNAIAKAFWGLLASEPASLANYKDRFMSNDGHGISPTKSGYWSNSFHLEFLRGSE